MLLPITAWLTVVMLVRLTPDAKLLGIRVFWRREWTRRQTRSEYAPNRASTPSKLQVSLRFRRTSLFMTMRSFGIRAGGDPLQHLGPPPRTAGLTPLLDSSPLRNGRQPSFRARLRPISIEPAPLLG